LPEELADAEELHDAHVAAGTTSHTTAKIADSAGMCDHGMISHLNPEAEALGQT